MGKIDNSMTSKRKIKQIYNNLSIANKKGCKNGATYYSLDKEYYLDYEVDENTGIINKNKLVRYYNEQQVERQLNGK